MVTDSFPAPVVLAAVDDDGYCGTVVALARDEATRLGRPLRLVHVWFRPRTARDGDQFLSACVHDHLCEDAPTAVERQILHDDDPARALEALSRQGVLLVVGAGGGGAVGDTTRELTTCAACPLMVVPAGLVAYPVHPSSTRGRWRRRADP